MMWFEGRMRSAYRLAYALWNGSVGIGYVIHHKCENRLCLKPGHLQRLTHSEHGLEHVRLRRRA